MMTLIRHLILKSKLTKVIVLSIAFILLLSSINWKVNFHICGDYVVNYALFVDAESCGMEESISICEYDPENGTLRKTCCTNKDVIISGNDVFRIQNSHVNVDSFSPYLISSSSLATSLRFETANEHYDPPWLIVDHPSVNQVYII